MESSDNIKNLSRSTSSLINLDDGYVADDDVSQEVTKTAVNAMATELSGVSLSDDRVVTPVRSGTQKEVVTVLTYELAKVKSMRSLLEAMQNPTLASEKPATYAECQAIFKEETEVRNYRNIRDHADLATQITTLNVFIAEFERVLSKPNEVPHDILVDYEKRFDARKNVQNELAKKIDALIEEIQKSPKDNKELLSDLDKSLAETQVIRQVLELSLIEPGLDRPLGGLDVAVMGKKMYGCTVPSVMNGENNDSFVSIINNQRDPLIAKLFRDFTVETTILEVNVRRDAMHAAISDDEVLPLAKSGEQYAHSMLCHYRDLAQELKSTPKEERNPTVTQYMIKHAEWLMDNGPWGMPANMKAILTAPSDGSESREFTFAHRVFTEIAPTRIEEARVNLASLNAAEKPRELLELYRNKLINGFSEIIHNQNLKIESGYHLVMMREEKKAIASVALVNAINTGRFTTLLVSPNN